MLSRKSICITHIQGFVYPQHSSNLEAKTIFARLQLRDSTGMCCRSDSVEIAHTLSRNLDYKLFSIMCDFNDSEKKARSFFERQAEATYACTVPDVAA